MGRKKRKGDVVGQKKKTHSPPSVPLSDLQPLSSAVTGGADRAGRAEVEALVAPLYAAPELFPQLEALGQIKRAVTEGLPSPPVSASGAAAAGGAAGDAGADGAGARPCADTTPAMGVLLELFLSVYLDDRCEPLHKVVLGVLTACHKVAPDATRAACDTAAAASVQVRRLWAERREESVCHCVRVCVCVCVCVCDDCEVLTFNIIPFYHLSPVSSLRLLSPPPLFLLLSSSSLTAYHGHGPHHRGVRYR